MEQMDLFKVMPKFGERDGHQTEMIQFLGVTVNLAEVPVKRIRRRFEFGRNMQPIPVPDFFEDMLFVDEGDKIVFKRCKECGVVFGFNTNSAYAGSLVTCYQCGESQLARQMSWKVPSRKIVRSDGLFLGDDHKIYRLEVEEQEVVKR